MHSSTSTAVADDPGDNVIEKTVPGPRPVSSKKSEMKACNSIRLFQTIAVHNLSTAAPFKIHRWSRRSAEPASHTR
jgi:hypothetical protein